MICIINSRKHIHTQILYLHAYAPTNLPMGFDKHNEETDIHFLCVHITIPSVSITAN